MTTPLEPLSLLHGPAMQNRMMLAPLTNGQSHADGVLSDEEQHWLTVRATGGFGLTMTCAAHVSAGGQGFGGQLGVFDDVHLPGLTGLAEPRSPASTVSSCTERTGYLLCQFLSPEINRRTDHYGGSLENRQRLLFDIVTGIRAECGPDFALAVRLSSDRFGILTEEMVEVVEYLRTSFKGFVTD